jgi:diaminopimelate dehydrogenase
MPSKSISTDKIRIAVVGYGNIGRFAVEAVQESPDMVLAGVVRRAGSSGKPPVELTNIPVSHHIDDLGEVDVALLCGPTRSIPEQAPEYLRRGIHTVDSFDIHGQPLWDLRQSLDKVGKQHNSVAVISSGWDPGTDSVLRTMLLAMAPRGLTYTNFGPGMSMGHSVCAKSKPGVRDAISMTIPAGNGVHKRMVYVELEDGADFASVEQAIRTDDYFAKDDTRIFQVESVDALKNVGHGVCMERRGVSGRTHNQWFEFRMTIHNPALTAQVMVSCARASTRLSPGAYTLPEIPPMDLLPGDREAWIKSLV